MGMERMVLVAANDGDRFSSCSEDACAVEAWNATLFSSVVGASMLFCRVADLVKEQRDVCTWFGQRRQTHNVVEVQEDEVEK